MYIQGVNQEWCWAGSVRSDDVVTTCLPVGTCVYGLRVRVLACGTDQRCRKEVGVKSILYVLYLVSSKNHTLVDFPNSVKSTFE